MVVKSDLESTGTFGVYAFESLTPEATEATGVELQLRSFAALRAAQDDKVLEWVKVKTWAK